MTDPYVVLGVARTATFDEITRAYRAQLRTHHPDSSRGSGCNDTLQDVIEAYASLRDAYRRAACDLDVASGPPPTPHRLRRTRIVVRHRKTGATATPSLRVGPVRWHRGN